MLQETERLAFRHVVRIDWSSGQKLIKVAAGIFPCCQHSHIADGRMETLVTQLALLNAPNSLLQQIYRCPTTGDGIDLGRL